jgi:hypothetical protein
METKHTPGPWTVDDGETLRIRGADKSSVCTINWLTLTSRRLAPEGYANARLIAAAPDLLDALLRLVARIEVNGGIGEYTAGPAFVMQSAYDAIAKATRGQQ